MWVRAVAVAVVVACCAVTAQAAQYAEVWNPPEARHAPKKVHVSAPAGKKVAAKGTVGGKNKRPKVEPKKASLHAARQVKSRSGLAAKSAPGKMVKTAHSKVVRVQTAAMHSKSQKMATKPASTPTTAAMAKPPARAVPAQPAATMVNTAANSAGASRDLPPILH